MTVLNTKIHDILNSLETGGIFHGNTLSVTKLRIKINYIFNDLEEKGIAQGSILCLTLLSIRINDVFSCLKHGKERNTLSKYTLRDITLYKNH